MTLTFAPPPAIIVTDELMGLIVAVLFMMIPIIWILTSHQQRMARIVRSDAQQLPSPEILQLRHEVQHLRDLVSQQTLAIDQLAGLHTDLVKCLDERGALRERLTADERAS